MRSHLAYRYVATFGLVASSLFYCYESSAGVMATTLESTCEDVAPPDPSIKVVTSVQSYQGVNNSGKFLLRDARQSGQIVECISDTLMELSNVPKGPSIGTTLERATLKGPETEEALEGFRKAWRGGVDVWRSMTVTRSGCLQPECEAFARLNLLSVYVLREGIAPPAVIIETPGDSSETRSLSIPFLVVASGGDGWLEMSNRGRVFWKSPMRNLRAGKIYFAVVPRDFVTQGPGVWTVYLNGDENGDSVVYLPLPGDQLQR